MVTAVLVVAGVALAWKLYQLGRAPRDRSLRVVVAAVAALTMATALPELGVNDGFGAYRLALNLSSLAFVYLVGRFFQLTADEGDPDLARRARRELGVLGATAAVMTVALFATPEPGRLTSSFGPFTDAPAMALFYTVGSAYLTYGVGKAAQLAGRCIAHAGPRVAVGLRITVAGLLGCLLSASGRLVSTLARWAGHPPPGGCEWVLQNLLIVSFMVFLAGVSYPGLVTRLTSTGRWLRHRRRYAQMQPLWSLLHEAFPHTELIPARGRFGLGKLHQRYYRRAIECRDGLVQLSPYLAARAQDHPADPGAVQGNDLIAALQDRAAGRPVSTTAVPVAVPAGDDLDDDVAALVRLSQTLTPHPAQRRHPWRH